MGSRLRATRRVPNLDNLLGVRGAPQGSHCGRGVRSKLGNDNALGVFVGSPRPCCGGSFEIVSVVPEVLAEGLQSSGLQKSSWSFKYEVKTLQAEQQMRSTLRACHHAFLHG